MKCVICGNDTATCVSAYDSPAYWCSICGSIWGDENGWETPTERDALQAAAPAFRGWVDTYANTDETSEEPVRALLAALAALTKRVG